MVITLIIGCKQYALEKTINNKTIKIIKCKGYQQHDTKLTMKDFESINQGRTLKQEQNQSRKKNASLETDNRTVIKQFQKVYRKGTINDDDTIKPISI